jgi:hypothetical protein
MSRSVDPHGVEGVAHPFPLIIGLETTDLGSALTSCPSKLGGAPMRPDYSAPIPTPTPTRWWRLRPWNRNHLMRRTDRYEGLLVLAAATLVLLLIPIAAAVGTATHTRRHPTRPAAV